MAVANSPASVAQRCDIAAVRAADKTGVPRDVLLAISRVETGRTVAGRYIPWPWTTNQGGNGAWFTTADAAVEHATQVVASGQTNIDIGCFQINYRWHGGKFPSVESMFDPEANALYAARYLQELFAQEGAWEGAIGAYHSRKEKAAAGYLKKVTAVMGDRLPDTGIDTVSTPTMAQDPPSRENRYPLLRAGSGRMPGSLVSTRDATATTSLLR